MELLPKRIHEILRDKGVSSILHADSIENSCLFLRNRCLMSRASIEKLAQQKQPRKPNHSDTKYGIWNDIFTDTIDIHNEANSMHNHGPALLELDIEIIKNTYMAKVWITKTNPMNWDANTHHERKWFVSAHDLEDNFKYGSSDHMVAFRHCAGKLPILGFLNRIILDDPRLRTDRYQIDYFSMAFGALKLALIEGGFDVPIDKRECNQGCSCLEMYKSENVDSENLFNL